MPRLGEVTELERMRRRIGLSVSELAIAMGRSHTTVSLVELGRMQPSADFRSRAAAVLGLPEQVLFPETDR